MSLPAQEWPTQTTVQESVRELAAATLGRSRVDPDAQLLNTAEGFDSFSLIEFVLRLESEFGIQIPDQDLDPDIFHSVRTVAEYVQSRLAADG